MVRLLLFLFLSLLGSLEVDVEKVVVEEGVGGGEGWDGGRGGKVGGSVKGVGGVDV